MCLLLPSGTCLRYTKMGTMTSAFYIAITSHTEQALRGTDLKDTESKKYKLTKNIRELSFFNLVDIQVVHLLQFDDRLLHYSVMTYITGHCVPNRKKKCQG